MSPSNRVSVCESVCVAGAGGLREDGPESSFFLSAGSAPPSYSLLPFSSSSPQVSPLQLLSLDLSNNSFQRPPSLCFLLEPKALGRVAERQGLDVKGENTGRGC